MRVFYISLATAERKHTSRHGYKSALDGLIIRNIIVKNGGGECIRLRCEYMLKNNNCVFKTIFRSFANVCVYLLPLSHK